MSVHVTPSVLEMMRALSSEPNARLHDPEAQAWAKLAVKMEITLNAARGRAYLAQELGFVDFNAERGIGTTDIWLTPEGQAYLEQLGPHANGSPPRPRKPRTPRAITSELLAFIRLLAAHDGCYSDPEGRVYHGLANELGSRHGAVSQMAKRYDGELWDIESRPRQGTYSIALRQLAYDHLRYIDGETSEAPRPIKTRETNTSKTVPEPKAKPKPASESDPRVSQLNADLAEANAELERLRAELTAAQDAEPVAIEEFSGMASELADTKVALSEAQTALGQERQRSAGLQSSLNELKIKLAEKPAIDPRRVTELELQRDRLQRQVEALRSKPAESTDVLNLRAQLAARERRSEAERVARDRFRARIRELEDAFTAAQRAVGEQRRRAENAELKIAQIRNGYH